MQFESKPLNEGPPEPKLPSLSKQNRILLVCLMSISLLATNFIGLSTLLGTGPGDELAPLFILGVGAFFSQFVLLGMYAALLPYSFPGRLALPMLLTLFLSVECKYFSKPFLLNGLASATLLGFFASGFFFSLLHSWLGFRLHDQGNQNTKPRESFGRYGIIDILTVTFSVAVVLTVNRIDSGEYGLQILLISFLAFALSAMLYAPFHLFAMCDKTKIWFCVSGLFIVVIVLPILLMMSVDFLGGKRDTAPYSFCLTFGAEATWLIGLGCMRLLGFRLVRIKRKTIAAT